MLLQRSKMIKVGDEHLNCLTYADDLAILAENELALQELLINVGA